MTTAAIYNSDLGATWTPAIHGENGIISITDIDPDHPTLHRHRMYLPTSIFSPVDRGFVRLSITPLD